MGKWIHTLTSVNTTTLIGICKNCGSTPIKQKDGHWRCINSIKAHQKGGLSFPKGKHGLTVPEAQEFRKGKVCELCGGTVRLAVDHCHKTKKIRGVLCQSCNVALGLLKDDTTLLRKAINYLEISAR